MHLLKLKKKTSYVIHFLKQISDSETIFKKRKQIERSPTLSVKLLFKIK